MSSGIDEVVKEESDGKRTSSFYDTFPDIQSLDKLYLVQQCSTKTGDFNVYELAKFIDDQFYSLADAKKDPNDPFVCSVASFCLGFRRWGARFESNSQHPYFKGHGEQDVVQNREKFVEHYLR